MKVSFRLQCQQAHERLQFDTKLEQTVTVTHRLPEKQCKMGSTSELSGSSLVSPAYQLFDMVFVWL